MDSVWCLNGNTYYTSSALLRNYYYYYNSPTTVFWNSRNLDLGIRVSSSNYCRFRSLSVRGKKDPDSSENSDHSKAGQEYYSIKGNGSNTSPLDWRQFRASLYIHELQAGFGDSVSNTPSGSKPLPLNWAHPISAPENGCLLLATEMLDHVPTFQRTVVLLLRSGTTNPLQSPFGLVINRPLHKKMRHIKPNNIEEATTLSDCPLHFGGPLNTSMFLLRTGEITGFEEVLPGLYFGSRSSLNRNSGLVKNGTLRPEDFRFFMGYSGWQLDQLTEEIESGFWYVAACSSNLLFERAQSSSADGLWEEVLQLMGGHYAELSRKPKRDT